MAQLPLPSCGKAEAREVGQLRPTRTPGRLTQLPPGLAHSHCLCRSKGWRSPQDTGHSQAQKTLCSSQVSVRDKACRRVSLGPRHPHRPGRCCPQAPPIQPGTAPRGCNPALPGRQPAPPQGEAPAYRAGSTLAQAHQDGLVAVMSAALLQDVEPSRVMGVDTLLGEDVLVGGAKLVSRCGS